MSAPTELATQSAIERLRRLPGRFAQQPELRRAGDELSQGGAVSVGGVWGSSRALLASSLLQDDSRIVAIVCPQDADIDSIAADVALFSRLPVHAFPALSTIDSRPLPSDETYGDRLRVLRQLLKEPTPRFIVASIHALIQPVPATDTLRDGVRVLRVGEVLPVEQLTEWLVEHGFEPATTVELPGEFAKRGGILDCYPPDALTPIRLEWFGDEIDSIREFDVSNQRSLATLAEYEFSIVPPALVGGATLASYLPNDSIVVMIEPAEVRRAGALIEQRSESEVSLLSVDEVFAEFARFPSVLATAIPEPSASEVSPLQITSVDRLRGNLRTVQQQLDEVAADDEVFIVCETEAEAERFSEIFADTLVAKKERLHFPVGQLHQGFRIVNEQLTLVSSYDLLERSHVLRKARKRMGRAIDTFLDLRPGDMVVHLAHGIGRYRGLELVEKDGRTEEHVQLEFRGGTKIYVPATRFDLVQKYVGGSKTRPRLSAIGGRTWQRQKEAAQLATQDVAIEMLDLQAKRQTLPGIQFPKDTPWQLEFDASFPFTETADQLVAVESIKRDMQQRGPMDRLLCGDVGFGKTELAMRAAFKAVEAGYQVAIMVPTTVLAEQHFRTFRERLAAFPFEIASLSRFNSAGEQRRILEQLANGKIDIVIGTHRLAQADVRFHNLGLLVIDEEQRFGVEIKERLKAIRQTVDVLTMTATPIPRTLHLSLLGVRDISSLETAPEDRVAVATRVVRFDENLVREAILRELNRGGQVYFVHNRVHDIEAVRQRLARIVPEALIAVGHGQMAARDLEQVMISFVRGDFDILLATTIVESGLDIPNANTILIDEADRYGLADLHQLRGRVGRYKNQAYCYLLLDPRKHLTPQAARRMRAIEEYSDMGAGFAIAMRDLELRGAGNLLGTQQSGHIAAVGYELYCSLLEQSIRQQQDLPPRESIEVSLELPIDAYLPDEYVAELRAKVDLYRRLSRIVNEEELETWQAELSDRFGEIPVPALNLLALARLRIWAHGWRIRAAHLETGFLVLKFSATGALESLQRGLQRELRRVDPHTAYVPLSSADEQPGALLATLKSVLQPRD